MKKLLLIIPIFLVVGYAFAEYVAPMIFHPRITVSGTEYSPGDNGRTFIQLLDEYFQPINDAICLINVYYPNNSVWFEDASMLHLDNSDGLYYFDFIAPYVEGVYMLSARCFYSIYQTYDYADDYSITLGSVPLFGGTVSDTWKDDENYHTIRESSSGEGGYGLDFYYEFDNVSIPENYTGMTVYWIGKWVDGSENVINYIYNWCNSSWMEMDNEISSNTPMVSNYLDSSEWNISCLVSSDGVTRVRFKDTDWTDSSRTNFQTDFIDVQIHYATYQQINNVRGGGEIHVAYEKAITEPSEETPTIGIIS